jgi:hypothetical protein
MKTHLLTAAIAACLTSGAYARPHPSQLADRYAFCQASHLAGIDFMPNWGTVHFYTNGVGRFLTHRFTWSDPAALSWFRQNPDSTFALDTSTSQLSWFNGIAGHVSTDLPGAYIHWTTQRVAATIGSAKATEIVPNHIYFTTGELEYNIFRPKLNGPVTVVGQKGVTRPRGCYDQRCVYACSEDNNFNLVDAIVPPFCVTWLFEKQQPVEPYDPSINPWRIPKPSPRFIRRGVIGDC